MANTTDIAKKNRAEMTRPEEAYRTPAVDIYETDESVVLLADMPGVGEDGMEVSTEEDRLSIIGRVTAKQPADAVSIHTEFEPLVYRRVFTLSSDLDTAGVEGKIQNGVLRLILPKAEESRVRKIPIKAE